MRGVASRLVLTSVLAALPAYGQVLAIGTPKDFVIVGETIPLTPVLRAANGDLLNATEWVWTSTTPNTVAVDAQGNLTGVAPGPGTIQVSAPAQAGSQFASLDIQVQPKSFTINPASQNLEVGGKVQFTAVATDVNDQPIGNLTVHWYLTGQDGSSSQVPANVTIAEDGTFAGNAAGTYTVRADLFYPLQYGKLSHIEALAQAVVTLPRAYSLKRLISNDPIPAKTLRASPGFFAAGNTGTQVFTASPDGLSTAVIAFNGATARRLLTTGTPSPVPGGVVAGFQAAAMNSQGDTLLSVKAGDVSNGALLAVPASGEPAYVLLDNSVGADQTGNFVYQMTFLHLTQYSLSDTGNAVIRALYRPQDATSAELRNGLFLLRSALSPRLVPQLVWSEDVSPGAGVPLTGTPPRFSIAEDNTEPQPGWMGTRDFGIDNNDNIYFMAQSGANRALFAVQPGSRPQKLLAVGDTFLTSKVKLMEDLVVMSSGDLAMRVDLQNGQVQVVLFQKNVYASSLLITGSSNMRVLAASSAGVLFEGVPLLNQTEGLYKWTAGSKTATSVLPLSATVKYISTASIDSKGSVVAVIQTPTNAFVLARPGAANLFSAGPAAGLDTYVDLAAIVRGTRNALPSMQISSPASLFDIDGNGNPVGRVVIGDSGFTGTDKFVEDPAGAQYYVSGGTLYRYNAGQTTSLVARGFKASDGVLLTPNRAYGTNSQGAVVFDCGTSALDGHIRLYLYRNGTLTLVARNQIAFGASQLVSWSEAVVDAGNRVAFIANLLDGQHELALFDGKTTNVASSTRVSSLAGERVAGFSQLRATAGDFYVRTALTAEFTHAAVVTFNGGALRALVKSGDALPDGTSLGDIRLADANAGGDVIFAATVYEAGTQLLGYRSASGEIKFICANNQQLETGDYIVRFSDISFRDDGTVYFLAFDVYDRALVFQARPVSAQ